MWSCYTDPSLLDERVALFFASGDTDPATIASQDCGISFTSRQLTQTVCITLKINAFLGFNCTCSSVLRVELQRKNDLFDIAQYQTDYAIFMFNFKLVIRTLTHLSLASHKRDIGKQCRPRSDATERGVWSESTLFALNAGISVNHCDNKNQPDNPSFRNGRIERVKVGEFTQMACTFAQYDIA